METKNEGLTLVNGLAPALPVPPGSILGEELKSRGISQKAFAQTIGIQASHLSALIHGTRSFTDGISAKIEQGLGNIPASFWLKLQAQYTKDKNRQERRYSSLVDGYANKPAPVACLMDSGILNQQLAHVSVILPVSELNWLEHLAEKMGWTLSER